MKTLVPFLALAGVFLPSMPLPAEDEEKPSLVGVWERVEIHFVDSGKTMTDSEAYTIFTEEHFSYLDNLGKAHWGTYTVEEDTITRHRVLSTDPEAKGTDSKAQELRFEEGDLILSWEHPEAGPMEVRLRRLE